MVKSRNRPKAPANAVGTGHKLPKAIGIIGKRRLTPEEQANLWYIGRCLARLKRPLVLIPTEGTANTMRKGIDDEGGEAIEVTKGVIETATHTFIYPDTPLTNRLRETYPDIEERPDITIIKPTELFEWVNAIRSVLQDKGVTLPQ